MQQKLYFLLCSCLAQSSAKTSKNDTIPFLFTFHRTGTSWCSTITGNAVNMVLKRFDLFDNLQCERKLQQLQKQQTIQQFCSPIVYQTIRCEKDLSFLLCSQSFKAFFFSNLPSIYFLFNAKIYQITVEPRIFKAGQFHWCSKLSTQANLSCHIGALHD